MTSSLTEPHSFVLGVGRNRSLSDVVQLALKELSRVDGAPRRLIAIADTLELEAERESTDQQFSSFIVRAALTPEALNDVEQLIAEGGPSFSMERQEEQVEIRIQQAEHAVDEPATLLARLSDAIAVPETWRVRGVGHRDQHLSPDSLFRAMEETRASDMHLFPGSPPVVRVNGLLRPTEDFDPLSAHQILDFIQEIAPAEVWQKFEADKQCSFRYHQIGRAYSRVSAFVRGYAPHCTLRYLPEEIPSFEELMLPVETMRKLANLHEGLVLVTGMTGSGKSSTVAALIDWINEHKSLHILTIEDPIEFVHPNKKSLVSQREAGADFVSFTDAIHGAVRQDPDVIFVGEMRDADTVRAVIEAAATGHLVISTLHAATAADAANRIVSFFEPRERDLVSNQLEECIRCIMSQRLVPRSIGAKIAADEHVDDFEYYDFADGAEETDGDVADREEEGATEPESADSVDFTADESAVRVAADSPVPEEPTTDQASGRVPALEFLFNDTKHISDSIVRGNTRSLRIGMQQTFSDSSIFEESLLKLLRAGLITEEVASAYAPHPESLEQMKLGTYRPPTLESMVHE